MGGVPRPPASSPDGGLGGGDADEGGTPTFRFTDRGRRRFAAAALKAEGRPREVSNDIRNPTAGDIENPAIPVTLTPRPEPAPCLP
jgi:hypothetical protein